jgi:protein ImuA
MASSEAGLSQSPRPADEPLIQALRAKLRNLETTRPDRDNQRISSGCSALDRLLPQGGFCRGSLVECLGDMDVLGTGLLGTGLLGTNLPGAGVGTFGLLLAHQAARDGGAIVVLDRDRRFYPPAADLFGIDLHDLLVIHPTQHRDMLWAIDQALRCPAVAAVWAPLQQLASQDFRRLQLAAQAGHSLGILIRDDHARGQPSWADIQLLVQPRPANTLQRTPGRRLRIEITRCRHGRHDGSLELELDESTGRMRSLESSHEANTLHLASQLAHPTPGDCSSRAQ